MSGDAQEGRLYLINIKKREATVLSDISLIDTTQAAAAGLAHIGVNGLKVRNDELYFINTAKGTYGTLPVNTTTGQPIGRTSLIANYVTDVAVPYSEIIFSGRICKRLDILCT